MPRDFRLKQLHNRLMMGLLLRCRSTVTLAFIGLALGLGCSRLSAARPQLDLTGTWDFYPDVGDAGLESMTVKPGTIRVPGAWQAQGYGKAGGTIPASLLEANTSPADHLRHNLTARCLYVRAVEVPANLGRKRNQTARIGMAGRRGFVQRASDVVSLTPFRFGSPKNKETVKTCRRQSPRCIPRNIQTLRCRY